MGYHYKGGNFKAIFGSKICDDEIGNHHIARRRQFQAGNKEWNQKIKIRITHIRHHNYDTTTIVIITKIERMEKQSKMNIWNLNDNDI